MPPSTTATTPLLLDGARTPFLSYAGAYAGLRAHELAARLLSGLLGRTGIDPHGVGGVALGTVVHDRDTSNVARSAWLEAGLPSTVPAWTTSMAGLSPNVAVTSVADAIALGRLDLGLAGGVESFSTVPILLGQQVRRTVMKLRRARTPTGQLAALAALRPRDLTVDLVDFPSPSDSATGLTMGESTERMARRFGVGREESDAFAARSHARAVLGWADGWHGQEVLPIRVDGTTVTRDDGPRADTSVEVLAGLAPAFDGVITAGSASGITDGAAAVVLGTADAAERTGLEPLAALHDTVLVGVDDPVDEQLLGPAVAVPRLLERAGLTMDDVGVFEVHEAFATQVLANQARLAGHLGDGVHEHDPVGPMPEDRLNVHGGSIALGNPFGATGARLLTTAARRLVDEDARWAVVASCAGGGLGTAMLLGRAG